MLCFNQGVFMSKVDLWGWDKKKRTMIRFIKSGDVFCFRIRDDLYGYGRVISISILDLGAVAEIQGYSFSPESITEYDIINRERIFPPLLLDSYMLFDRKSEKDSDWRIIGHQHDYTSDDGKNIFFTYGEGNSCKKVNVFGEVVSITPEEASRLPRARAQRDIHIKKMLNDIVQ